jgi:hypothetical protein
MRDLFNCNTEEKIDFLNKAPLMGEGQDEGEQKSNTKNQNVKLKVKNNNTLNLSINQGEFKRGENKS